VLSDQAAELLTALRGTLPKWDCVVDGERVAFSQTIRAPYRPRKRMPAWPQLLGDLSAGCSERGIVSSEPLPLRGMGDADFTFSAVQALEPYLKHRQQHIHGVGYIPQPVVRFTGERNQRGTLQPGFLTSFINVSVVQPISTIPEHAALIDAWLSVLSRIGLHSQHITIAGMLSVWRRREVAGITLWFRHGDLTLGDAVLLWNTTDPRFLATDIGSGLERLRWAVASRPWPETVYDRLAAVADTETLDALRTATLVAGSGVRPILGDQVTLCVASCGGSRTA